MNLIFLTGDHYRSHTCRGGYCRECEIPGWMVRWTGVGGNAGCCVWPLVSTAGVARWAAPGYKLEGHRPILLLNSHRRDNSVRHNSPWWGVGCFKRIRDLIMWDTELLFKIHVHGKWQELSRRLLGRCLLRWSSRGSGRGSCRRCS